jgi:lysophospholipase L1-like esterase
MQAQGIETHNLNDLKYFADSPNDIFIDGTHLTPDGNNRVARILFNLINKKWQ